MKTYQYSAEILNSRTRESLEMLSGQFQAKSLKQARLMMSSVVFGKFGAYREAGISAESRNKQVICL